MGFITPIRYAVRFRNWREVLRAKAEDRTPPVVILRRGPRFEAPEGVSVTRLANEIFFHRVYALPGGEIGPEDVVVDVGANVGVFSVYAAARTRGRIVAVEPFPQNVEFLRRNLRANGCERVEVVPSALSDHEGTLELAVAKKGTMHSIAPAAAEGGERVKVPATTLARIVEQRGLERIDLLKMDCEGAEGVILPTLPKDVLARVQRMALEFHDHLSPVSHEALRALLEANGFSTTLRSKAGSTVGMLYAFR